MYDFLSLIFYRTYVPFNDEGAYHQSNAFSTYAVYFGISLFHSMSKLRLSGHTDQCEYRLIGQNSFSSINLLIIGREMENYKIINSLVNLLM